MFKAIHKKEMLRKQENRNKYIDKCKDKYDQIIKQKIICITCELHFAHVDISNHLKSALCRPRLGFPANHTFDKDLKVNLWSQAQGRYKV